MLKCDQIKYDYFICDGSGKIALVPSIKFARKLYPVTPMMISRIFLSLEPSENIVFNNRLCKVTVEIFVSGSAAQSQDGADYYAQVETYISTGGGRTWRFSKGKMFAPPPVGISPILV